MISPDAAVEREVMREEQTSVTGVLEYWSGGVVGLPITPSLQRVLLVILAFDERF
jgi:hypothetical protein